MLCLQAAFLGLEVWVWEDSSTKFGSSLVDYFIALGGSPAWNEPWV